MRPNYSEDFREKVKLVALQIGVRDAARQFDLSENTVMAWSRRYEWFTQQEQTQAIVERSREERGMHALARKSPSEVMASYKGKTQLAQAKVLHKTAKHLQTKDPDELILLHQVVKSNVDASDKVFGYSVQGTTAVQVNVNLSNHRFEEA